jgi:co-chaperonin GroES (HSP10)
MKLATVGHRILLKRDRIENLDPRFQSAIKAGLAIPSDHEDMLRRQAGIDRGEVIQVGPNAFMEFNRAAGVDHYLWCKPGDTIIFAKYAGKPIVDPNDPSKEYIVINDEDVVCLIVDEDVEVNNE